MTNNTQASLDRRGHHGVGHGCCIDCFCNEYSDHHYTAYAFHQTE